jgi:hypothetical protein
VCHAVQRVVLQERPVRESDKAARPRGLPESTSRQRGRAHTRGLLGPTRLITRRIGSLLDVDSAAQRAGYTHSVLIFVIRNFLVFLCNYLVLLCNYLALLFRSTKFRHCAFQKWVADSDPKILVGPHHP